MKKRLMVALASVILGLGLATGPVSADHPGSKTPADCTSGSFTNLGQCVPFVNPGVQVYRYDLHPVPHDRQRDGGSNARGTGVITVVGNLVIVEIIVQGMSPGLVHVQHIHGIGANRCPGPEARDDRVADGLIDSPLAPGLPLEAELPAVCGLTGHGRGHSHGQERGQGHGR